MRDFFKPWRRKLCVVTLLLACVFAAGWVRSTSISDKVTIPSQSTRIEFWSMQSKFSLMRVSQPHSYERRSSRIEQASDHPMNLLSAEWSWRFCGLRLFWNLDAYAGSITTLGFVIPYWLPIIPLTLLSAYLLLSKQPSKRKTTEPPKGEP